jgi:cytochrome c556
MRLSMNVFVAPAIVCVGARSIAYAGDNNNDAVDYREHIMNTLYEQSEALGQILSTTIPDDNAIGHLDSLALTASIALKAFEQKVPGGEAKPEVWSNWADFSKRMNELAQRTAAVAKDAHEHGKGAALAELTDALSCKSCHESYRHEKK